MRTRVADCDPNHHPSLDDDVLRLAGEEWIAAGSVNVGEPCDGEIDSELPTVRRGEKVAIAVRSRGEDREPLPKQTREEYGGKSTEGLLYYHFATLPGLERPFSALDPDSDDDRFDVAFELDEQSRIDRAGTVVGFVMVVRDDRGGIDWTVRRLCARR
jgi:hypothetical protein